MILLELSFIMDKRKKGIALFITLMVIASIMSIIAVSFTYLEKVQKDAGVTSAIIQGDLLYKDTVKILKRFFPKGSDNSDKLTLIYSMPLMLNEAKSGFALNINCSPLMVGVPISWLDEKLTRQVPDKTLLANDVLENVMEQYEVEEPSRLKEVLLEAVTGIIHQNSDYTPRIKIKKGIISKAQFDRIIIEYRLLYDDEKVLTIPWERYFSFTEVNSKTKIDGMFLSAEFISAAFEIPLEMVQESWIPGESKLQTFLSENGTTPPQSLKKIYANKGLTAMHCEQTYTYQERYYKFNFDYIEGRSGNFEFNGQKQ